MVNSLTSLSIAELRARSQPSAPEGGRETYVGQTIRFFSIFVTKLLLHTRLTPNLITVIGVSIFLIGISLFVVQNMYVQLGGIFLIYFSIVLDACDGEIARLRGNPSGVGGLYTEPVSHDIQYSYMFMPIAVGLYLGGYPEWILLAGWLTATAKLLQRFLIARFDNVRLFEQKNARSESDGEGDIRISMDPNVSFPHKVYRFLNRNIFSSVGLIIPLTFCTLIQRLDLFIFSFGIFFSCFTILHFLRQAFHVRGMSKKALSGRPYGE
jgi:hypothetical protein